MSLVFIFYCRSFKNKTKIKLFCKQFVWYNMSIVCIEQIVEL